MESTSRISRYFLILLINATCLISLTQTLPTTSGSGTTTTCEEGYKYSEEVGECCINDCSGETSGPVCASNGIGYKNKCEFEKAKCTSALKNTVIIYEGNCVTLPPPPAPLCEHHLKRIDEQPIPLECTHAVLSAKAANGSLTVEDLLPCYRPKCKDGKYRNFQCITGELNGYCWCSNPEGDAIEGTMAYGKRSKECDRKSCVLDGVEHKDGSTFTPESGCGICGCLDGQVNCWEDYVPDMNGQLNDSQVDMLKDEVVELFYFQYKQNEHVRVDIRKIHQNPTTISSSIKKDVLEWKFNYYDRSNSKKLIPGEVYLFEREVDSFFGCSKFVDHVVEEFIDTDIDDFISIDEWRSFFEVEVPELDDLDVRKRSAPSDSQALRLSRPQRKNKFYYLLQ